MKKAFKPILQSAALPLLAATLLTGCDMVHYYFSSSYVLGYMEVGGIELKQEGGAIAILPDAVAGKVSVQSEGEDRKFYDEICAEHGDVAYNRNVGLVSDIITEWGLHPDIASVTVTSDKDFDAAHPAGTPLNDCTELTYCSAYDYVSSGYDQSFLTYDSPKEKTEPLTEVSAGELSLMLEDYGLLTFTSSPETKGAHRISVTLNTADGRSFSASMDYEFN